MNQSNHLQARIVSEASIAVQYDELLLALAVQSALAAALEEHALAHRDVAATAQVLARLSRVLLLLLRTLQPWLCTATLSATARTDHGSYTVAYLP